jgi:adenylate kinase
VIVWVTGISGIDRRGYVEEAARIGNERTPGRYQAIDVGTLLENLPPHIRVQPSPTALLDGNPEVLRLHRVMALKDLMAELGELSPAQVALVSTHACFMREGRLLAGLDMAFLKQSLALEIDLYATVIGDCYTAWEALEQRSEWRGKVSFSDIAIWRDFEAAMTRMLAEYEGKPFYLLARQDPPASLAGITAEPPRPSVYLSFPITRVQEETPDLIQKARDLADDLRRRGFVVFDPLAIMDVPGTREKAGMVSSVPKEQVEAARLYLTRQTNPRDLQLIDQADMVVVYYPTTKDSPGVSTEMGHARDRRKPLYLCAYPGAPDSVSPFLHDYFTEAFADTPELIQFLASKYIAQPPDAESGGLPRTS